MNLHAFIDRMVAVLGGFFAGSDRFFARSLEGAPLEEVIRATEIAGGTPLEEGRYELEADTPAGVLNPAYRVARWRGPGYPTLLYNQGSGERAFDFSARSKNTFRSVVLEAEPAWAANLIVLRAPFHQGSERDYARSMGEMRSFTAMIATSVVLTERLVAALREAGRGRVVVAGISLGGWVTNLHAALFGTADRYVPLLAGTALGELFVASSYRRLVAAPALGRAEAIRRVLNFETAFRQAPHENVFPLLARYDQYIRCDRQERSYGPVPVTVIDRGHVTAALSPALLRAHLHQHLV